MRQSKDAAAATRRRIVETASRAYRRDGLAGIGLAGLMREAGLTHGGFYKHFDSKDALVAEALDAAFAETGASLRTALDRAPAGEGLAALLDAYLSPAHRDMPAHGCALAALGPEAARAGPEIRAALAAGEADLVGLVAARLRDPDPAIRLADARLVVSAMVGALVLARALPDRAAASAHLRETKARLLARFGGSGPPPPAA